MAIPSFDELLQKAQFLADQQQDNTASVRTNTAIAGGVSGFFDKLLNTPYGKREVYPGYVDPKGTYNAYSTPIRTGQSLGERALGSLFGTDQAQPASPSGSVPVTQDQAQDYQTKLFLEKQKEAGALDVANVRVKGMIDAAKQRASGGGAMLQTVPEVVKNNIYDEMERRTSGTISAGDRKPITLGEMAEFRRSGLIGDSFVEQMVRLLKDPLLGMPKDAIQKAFQMQEDVTQKRFGGKGTKARELNSSKQSFKTDADALAAFKAKTVKAGETVSINGEDVILK